MPERRRSLAGKPPPDRSDRIFDPALVGQSEPAERAWHPKVIDPSLLRPGTNTLAIEVHQQSQASNDISFDFELLGEVGNPDSDADGLPDAWEQAVFGSLAHSAVGDADGDGANNGVERLARTNPSDGSSVFRAELNTTPSATLSWPSVIGITYRVHVSDDLTDWTALLETIKGTGATLTWTDDGVETGGAATRRFYRVGASQ